MAIFKLLKCVLLFYKRFNSGKSWSLVLPVSWVDQSYSLKSQIQTPLFFLYYFARTAVTEDPGLQMWFLVTEH